jgi:hypothetical protein
MVQVGRGVVGEERLERHVLRMPLCRDHQRVGEEEGFGSFLLAIVVSELQKLQLLRIVRGRIRALIEADHASEQRSENRGHHPRLAQQASLQHPLDPPRHAGDYEA